MISGSGIASGRGLLTAVLIVAFAWSLTTIAWSDDLLHTGGQAAIGQFFGGLLRLDLSGRFLQIVATATWQTIAYALTGMTVAILIGAVLGVAGAGIIPRLRITRIATMGVARTLLGAFRAIHELVWAWLFVVAIGLSPIAGVLAIGIPYGGILGFIYAGHLYDTSAAPLRALEATGASRWQVLFYGRLPQALPDLVSYTLYRLECAIRSASVLSFVGLGGLGYQIQLSLDELQYGQVWTLLLVLAGLIVVVDLWSSLIRRSLTE